jgi:hypothetical protein
MIRPFSFQAALDDSGLPLEVAIHLPYIAQSIPDFDPFSPGDAVNPKIVTS